MVPWPTIFTQPVILHFCAENSRLKVITHIVKTQEILINLTNKVLYKVSQNHTLTTRATLDFFFSNIFLQYILQYVQQLLYYLAKA